MKLQEHGESHGPQVLPKGLAFLSIFPGPHGCVHSHPGLPPSVLCRPPIVSSQLRGTFQQPTKCFQFRKSTEINGQSILLLKNPHRCSVYHLVIVLIDMKPSDSSVRHLGQLAKSLKDKWHHVAHTVRSQEFPFQETQSSQHHSCGTMHPPPKEDTLIMNSLLSLAEIEADIAVNATVTHAFLGYLSHLVSVLTER